MVFSNDIFNDRFNKLSNREEMNAKNSKLSELIKKPITVGLNTTFIKTREILETKSENLTN